LQRTVISDNYFCRWRYIGEGFDDARLDTLFLAMPVSWEGTLVQYTGRLHRLHPGKNEVRIFDYVDREVPMLLRMFEKRLRGDSPPRSRAVPPRAMPLVARISLTNTSDAALSNLTVELALVPDFSTIATLSWLAASISTTTRCACPSTTLFTTVTHRTPVARCSGRFAVCLTISGAA
jgi:hypothetical protein